jgi:hypothetical protein
VVLLQEDGKEDEEQRENLPETEERAGEVRVEREAAAVLVFLDEEVSGRLVADEVHVEIEDDVARRKRRRTR